MMQEKIFNRKLLFENRKRFAQDFANYNFLYQEVANRLFENIEALGCDFASVLEIGGKDDYLREKLEKRYSSFLFPDSSLNLPSLGQRPEDLISPSQELKNKPASFFSKALDEESLDFADSSFDLIFSNLTFHFVNEIPQVLTNIKRLLKPNGVFICSFFGEENLRELRHVLFEVESEFYGAFSPRVAPTIDVKMAANLLQKAGFLNPISDVETIEISYLEPLNLLKDLKMMGQGNIIEKRSRKFMTKTFLDACLKKYQELYLVEGKIKASFDVVTIMGKN